MRETAMILGAGVPEGLGGAIAMRFARAGPACAGGRAHAREARRDSRADQAEGGSGEAIVADLTAEQGQDQAFDRLKEIGGRLAAVVYNAGNNSMTPFAELTPGGVRGLLARLLLRRLPRRQAGAADS